MESPSKILLGLEAPRCLYEYGLGWLLNVPLQSVVPAGDNHPVMVLPGLGTTDSSTYFLRNFLNKIGYQARPWNLGRNLGPRRGLNHLLDGIHRSIEQILEETGAEEISLIGWSLGGVYSREIAKEYPDKIRQVITLGTPFKNADLGTNAGKLYEILSRDTSHRDPKIIERISQPPPVPFTSIYSKSDGVVHWECSLEDETPFSQNVEIPGSCHLGLAHNPLSVYVIADRLTQTKTDWQPFTL